MNLFDLHCDTVYECATKHKDLKENDLHLDLNRGIAATDKWVQTFAFWIADDLTEEEQYCSYQRQLSCFHTFSEQYSELAPYHGEAEHSKCRYLLSVEGGSAIGGDLDRIRAFREDGIRMLTLTWNGENRIGGGAQSTQGLTSFGREVIRELEAQQIVVDVSHLNRKTFFDVCRTAEKPFIATHSNAFRICSHPRNLDDDQIKELAACDGLIGLNLFCDFLSSENDCKTEDFIRHIEYFLSCGAEYNLAIGTDFDGAKMPKWIKGIESLEMLFQNVLKYFGAQISRQIFFENAARFFSA